MVSSELRKLLSGRLTVILMAILLLANGLVTWNQQLPGTYSYTNVHRDHILTLYRALPADGKQALAALEQKEEVLSQAIYEEAFPGAPSTTDTGPLLTGDLYSERSLFTALISRVEPVLRYSALLEEIRDNGETLLLTGRYAPHSFPYENVIRSARVYDRLRDTQPQILYSGAVELLPGNGITELMVVLMCLLIALELLFSERVQGTLALCKPTCKGSLPLICSKVLAGFLWGAVGTLFLYGSNLLIGLIRCGLIDMGAPIQSVYGMIRSPLEITIGQYILLFLGTKLLWMAGTLSLACVASYAGRRLWQCMGLFLLMGALCFLTPGSLLNPLAQGRAEVLFGDYWNLNVLGIPVSNLTAAVILPVLICLGAFATTIVLHVKRAPVISDPTRRRRTRTPSVSLSLFSHEAWKLLIMNGALWVLLALIPLQILSYSRFETYISPMEQLYIQYSQVLSGPANGEKEAFLTQEEARFADLYTQLEYYGNALSRGEINEDAYSALTAGITRQLEREPVFHRARDQYRAIEAEVLDYVCLTPYERLLGREGQKDLLRQTILLILVLTMGLSGIYATEHETAMIQLLHTAERETASNKGKSILALIYGLIVAILAFAPQLVAVADQYGLPGLSSPARSVPIFPLPLGTVWMTLTLYGLLLMVLSAAIALLILYLSRLTKETAHTCLMATAILLPVPVIVLLLL